MEKIYIKDVKDPAKLYQLLMGMAKNYRIKRKLKVLAMKGLECYICGDKAEYIQVFPDYKPKTRFMLIATEGGSELTIDHVIPLAVGANGYRQNLEPCCLECNRIKGAHLEFPYLIKIHFNYQSLALWVIKTILYETKKRPTTSITNTQITS